MTEYSRDSVTNVIHRGIKRDIRVAIENECYRAVIILTYAGIDAMAFLGLPAGRCEVVRSDYIDWCDRFLRFDGAEQLSGREVYAARCAVLHTYTVESHLNRSEGVRTIIYASPMDPPVRSYLEVPASVLVSIVALAEAFMSGIDRFLVSIFSNPERAALADERLQKVLAVLPL